MADVPDPSFTVNQIVWGIVLLVLVVGFLALCWTWMRAWMLSIQAWLVKLDVGVIQLLLLQLRGVNIVSIVNAAILAKRDGIEVTVDQLAHHQLAGGNIRLVVSALVSAKRFRLPLTFDRAATIDLLGQDPVHLVSEAVHEANQIRLPQPAAASGILKDFLPPIVPMTKTNSAAMLLHVSPGLVGVVVGEPHLEAQMRFPQGDLTVQVRSATVPRPGDRLAVSQVDGLGVVVVPEVVAAPVSSAALPSPPASAGPAGAAGATH